MDALSGTAALREVEAMQGGAIRNDLRLERALTSPRRLLATPWERIADRRITVSPLNPTSRVA